MTQVATIKYLIFSCLVFISLFCSGILLYDALYFLPHRTEIAHLLSQSDPEDRNPSEILKPLIDASHQDTAPPSAEVARGLLNMLTPSTNQRALNWQIDFALWNFLVQLHIPKEQIYGLYCALAFNGLGHGANQLSKRIFSKPLSELSDEESASLILILRSPKQYRARQDSLNELRDQLLSRLRPQPTNR